MAEMFDREKKGTINIHEFGALFGYINQWKGTFEGYDRDRSGYIEQNELTSGLFSYSLQTCMMLIKQEPLTLLSFNDFSKKLISGSKFSKVLTMTGLVKLSKRS